MSNSYFYDNKLKYENIEIPKELEFMVNRTLKKGREKRRIKTIYKYGIGLVSTFLVFVSLVNIEDDQGVNIKILDKNTCEGIGSTMWSVLDGENSDKNTSENYLEVGFNEFTEEFIIEFNIYDKKNEIDNVLNENYISSFNVPIKLESQIFNSQLRDVKGISTNLIIK